MLMHNRLKYNPGMAKDWLQYDEETQIHLIDIFVHELKTTDEYLIIHCIEEIEALIDTHSSPHQLTSI